MKFEELSTLWNNETESEAKININHKLLKEASFRSVRDKLIEIKWGSIIEILINYIWLGFLIDFLKEYWSNYAFFVPALVLLIIAIYSIVFETYKLVQYYLINHHFSIVDAQRRLERLKYLETFDTNSLTAIIPIFFVPFLIVFAQGVLGIDVYELGLSGREILFGTAGSFIVGLIVIVFLKMNPNKQIVESIRFLKEINEIDQVENEGETI